MGALAPPGPAFTRKKGRLYRYYLCSHASEPGYDACPNASLAAGEVETAVVDQLRALFRAPELLARTFRSATELMQPDKEQAA